MCFSYLLCDVVVCLGQNLSIFPSIFYIIKMSLNSYYVTHFCVPSFPHLSCETPVYDRSGARSATIGRSFLKYIPPVSHVLCTMSYAPCPMHHAQCTMSYAPCPMHNVLCPMSYVLFMTRFSLCHSFLRSVLSPVFYTVHRPLADPEREARLYTYPFEIRFSHVENVLWTIPPPQNLHKCFV